MFQTFTETHACGMLPQFYFNMMLIYQKAKNKAQA